MLYIGVDLGTSAVKLLVMDETGDIKKIVSKEYPLFFPHPGWSEQDPQDWYRQSIAGLKELLAGCDKSQVAGISFGGQMHGLVALDKDDQVIRPAILWNDGRTGKRCRRTRSNPESFPEGSGMYLYRGQQTGLYCQDERSHQRQRTHGSKRTQDQIPAGW